MRLLILIYSTISRSFLCNFFARRFRLKAALVHAMNYREPLERTRTTECKSTAGAAGSIDFVVCPLTSCVCECIGAVYERVRMVWCVYAIQRRPLYCNAMLSSKHFLSYTRVSDMDPLFVLSLRVHIHFYTDRH